MIRIKKQALFLVNLAASALVMSSCMFGRSAATTQPTLQLEALQTPITEQVVFTVERGNVTQSVTFEGQVVLTDQQELFFGQSGRVFAINVKSGDRVEEGALIAEIDTRDLSFDLEEAALTLALAETRFSHVADLQSYNVQEAEIDLEIAQLRLQSYERLEKPDAAELDIRRRQIEQAELTLERVKNGLDATVSTDVNQLQTAVMLAELRLERLQAALSDSQIVAPFSGEVRLLETLREGRAVNAYDPVATVVNPDSYQIVANLVRDDMERLSEGSRVELELPYQNSVRIEGEIVTLPQPFGGGVGTQTIISLVNPTDVELMRAGAAVIAVVNLVNSEDTLWLPPTAVRGFGSNRFVIINEQGASREVPVEVGLSNSEKVEILSGLAAGMQVVAQ